MSKVEVIKNAYPKGCRVRLLSDMNDVAPILAGEEGTVRLVDDMGTIHVAWDNGRGLGLIPGIDNFCKIQD